MVFFQKSRGEEDKNIEAFKHALFLLFFFLIFFNLL